MDHGCRRNHIYLALRMSQAKDAKLRCSVMCDQLYCSEVLRGNFVAIIQSKGLAQERGSNLKYNSCTIICGWRCSRDQGSGC